MAFFSSLLNAAPGAIAQGLLWGIMAIGVYITYRILDVADLTVDGSLATGGAVCVMLMRSGCDPWLALMCAFLVGLLAGMATGLLHTRCGIPAILSGILTQLALYSVNLRIMGSKANQPISVDKYNLIVSQRFARELSLRNPLVPAIATLLGIISCKTGLTTSVLARKSMGARSSSILSLLLALSAVNWIAVNADTFSKLILSNFSWWPIPVSITAILVVAIWAQSAIRGVKGLEFVSWLGTPCAVILTIVCLISSAPVLPGRTTLTVNSLLKPYSA